MSPFKKGMILCAVLSDLFMCVYVCNVDEICQCVECWHNVFVRFRWEYGCFASEEIWLDEGSVCYVEKLIVLQWR